MAVEIFTSSIAKKLGMALTGMVLYGFLLGHLIGNSLLLRDDGGQAFNAYSEFLVTHPLIVPVELFLLATLVVHVYMAIRVSIENKRARPDRYQRVQSQGERSWASRTMIYSGILIFSFLVFHLLTFKYGDQGDGTLYDLVYATFQKPAFQALYIFSMVVLGFHLWHAFQSAFQTLGIGGRPVRSLGLILCLVLSLGFGLLPVFLGLLSK
jgi:succinate dehydrogenase / fumarate reductase cytochrome b subunit